MFSTANFKCFLDIVSHIQPLITLRKLIRKYRNLKGKGDTSQLLPPYSEGKMAIIPPFTIVMKRR
jgi:hypothetical protein